MGDSDEKQAVKKWLKELREKRGYTQKELAEIIGVDTRTILNAESATGSLPRGLSFLRLLRELGVVADAPVETEGGLAGRLAKLEEEVADGFASIRLLLGDPAAGTVREEPQPQPRRARGKGP